MNKSPSTYDRWKLLAFLTLAFFSPMFVAATDDESSSLEKARSIGRSKSRLLSSEKQNESKAAEDLKADVSSFTKTIAPILQASCIGCHGPKKSEGDLRVDLLNPDMLTGPDVQWWREIYDVVSNSDMPPQEEQEYLLTDVDRSRIADWLAEELNKASLFIRQKSESSSFRRMTKYEYDYAVRDLLGLSYPIAGKLPPESDSADGFKNSSEILQMSAMQFELYREIGLKALKRATVKSARPESVAYIISMHEEMKKVSSGGKSKSFNIKDKDYNKYRGRMNLIDLKTGQGFPFPGIKPNPVAKSEQRRLPTETSNVLAIPHGGQLKLNLDRFLPDEGTMRVSIQAGRSNQNEDEFVSLRLILSAHTSNDARFSQVISQRDIPVTASIDSPQYIHFDIQLGDIQRNPFRKLDTPFPRRDEFLTIKTITNKQKSDEPLQVLVNSIEIIAPFHSQWPPKTHTNIFFNSDLKRNEQQYGKAILSRFLKRIWRRPVKQQELDRFMTLFAKYRPEFESFEQAMIEVLAVALATPEFLYVTQRVSKGPDSKSRMDDDFELASRLSLFLWSSIPDEKLLDLAQDGKLNRPEVLRSEVQRMLADPRAERFSRNFVHQWLGMDRLQNATHVADESLREAMKREPVELFEVVLKNNDSVMDFIHADYVVVNETLAKHYRIPGVFGPHFRKVPVKSDSNRGGLLTGAAVLAMNSDGKDSHPLLRGVWMLERILNDPPPPPPANVPEVDLTDPEILKMSVKERIADHRNQPACSSCHARIDPWGIAFENYDAMGIYRNQHQNKPIDATSTLLNKEKLNGIIGLKRYLLISRQDQFTRALVEKMTAYALGRPLSFKDRYPLSQIALQFRKQGDRLEDLVQLIISSELFLTK